MAKKLSTEKIYNKSIKKTKKTLKTIDLPDFSKSSPKAPNALSNKNLNGSFLLNTVDDKVNITVDEVMRNKLTFEGLKKSIGIRNDSPMNYKNI